MSEDRRDEAIDVRLLGGRELPREEFPGGKGEVFRVFFTPEVHAAVWAHAAENTAVEICGVLVGTWQRDDRGPFVRITGSIRGQAAESKFAEVTFTHETWARINAEMDSKHVGLSIVGWYHTHPDFGVFLSDRDRFIQEHFFSGPGQVAHVVDPIRKTEGVFVWREGKPALAEHFWVGDRVLVGTAAGAEGRPASSASGTPPRPGAATEEAPRESGSFLPPPGRMMVYLGCFLVGYMLSGLRSSWEREMIEEGVLARLGVWKGLRLGLRDHLDLLERDLAAISKATQDLEDRAPKADGKPGEADGRVATPREIRDALAKVAAHVDQVKQRYGYTVEEEALILGMAKARALAKEREPSPAAEKGSDPPPTSAGEKPAQGPGSGAAKDSRSKP